MPKYDLWGHTDLDIEIPEDVFPDEAWLKERDELFGDPDHGYFESTYRGKKLHYRSNLPPKGEPVRAVVVYQHGIHGQSGFGCKVPSDGRLTDMGLRVRANTAKGYAIYAHDQLGHGFSEGERFYIPNGDWTVNRDDLVAFVGLVAAKHPPGTPLFLAGESYGGCLAFHASHALWNSEDKPDGLKGCVMGCPALDGDLPPWPVHAFLKHVLKPLAPTWTPFFMPHPIHADRLWKEEEVRNIMLDPDRVKGLSLSGVPFCLGTAAGLVDALETAQALMKDYAVPFHINHGSDDWGVPVTGSQRLFELCQTPESDKELNIVEGGYHCLMSELDAPAILQHEIDWMERRIQAAND